MRRTYRLLVIGPPSLLQESSIARLRQDGRFTLHITEEPDSAGSVVRPPAAVLLHAPTLSRLLELKDHLPAHFAAPLLGLTHSCNQAEWHTLMCEGWKDCVQEAEREMLPETLHSVCTTGLAPAYRYRNSLLALGGTITRRETWEELLARVPEKLHALLDRLHRERDETNEHIALKLYVSKSKLEKQLRLLYRTLN